MIDIINIIWYYNGFLADPQTFAVCSKVHGDPARPKACKGSPPDSTASAAWWVAARSHHDAYNSCMGLGGNHAFHKYDYSWLFICVAWFHMNSFELVGLCRVVSPFASGRQSLIKSAALMLWQRNVCILYHPFGMFLGKLLQDDGSMVQTMLWLLYVMPWDPSPLILNTPY